MGCLSTALVDPQDDYTYVSNSIMKCASYLDPFCQSDFEPIWYRSIDIINRSVPIFQIDRYKYLDFDSESTYFFRSIWKRFGPRYLKKSCLQKSSHLPHGFSRINFKNQLICLDFKISIDYQLFVVSF